MTSQKTPQVQAIAHVGLVVSDLAHQLDFWQNVLGFTASETAELGGPLLENSSGVSGARAKIAIVSKGGQTIELVQYLAPDDRATLRPRPVDLGAWHLALVVDDLDALIGISRKWGWQLLGQVATVQEGPGPVGARLTYIGNADGTTLELIQLPG